MSDCILDCDPAIIRQLIVLTQSGLPLVADPWTWLGNQLDMTPEATLALVQQLQSGGLIRRIAAVPNHYRLGYRHNGMTVWDVEDTQIDSLGEQLGNLSFISHCYKRPRRPGWTYNLFAMIHGRDATDLTAHRDKIRTLLGSACHASDMLISTRILKKTGLRLNDNAQDNRLC